jgi:hypothetical protein
VFSVIAFKKKNPRAACFPTRGFLINELVVQLSISPCARPAGAATTSTGLTMGMDRAPVENRRGSRDIPESLTLLSATGKWQCHHFLLPPEPENRLLRFLSLMRRPAGKVHIFSG